MANQATFPLRGTFAKEVFVLPTAIKIVGPQGGVGSSLSVSTAAGLTPQVLSGSSPNQYVSQYPVTWTASGSYTLNLNDVWPRQLAALFTIAASGSIPDTNWTVQRDLSVAQLTASNPSGVGVTGNAVNQVSFNLLKTGSKADPAVGETVVVDFFGVFQNYNDSFFNGGS